MGRARTRGERREKGRTFVLHFMNQSGTLEVSALAHGRLFGYGPMVWLASLVAAAHDQSAAARRREES